MNHDGIIIKIKRQFNSETYFLSRLPAPVSRNPFAKGLLSIFNCVICEMNEIMSLVLTVNRKESVKSTILT